LLFKLYKRFLQLLLCQIFTSVRIICSLVENSAKPTPRRSEHVDFGLLHNYWIELHYSHVF